MRLDPFIEAEEVAGRSVKHCCELFTVSRAAYYQRRSNVPSPREVSDGELLERIKEVHGASDGTYGSPRVHHELLDRGVNCGRRRVRRLMRTHGLEGRCKKRWRKTTIADPGAQTEAWTSSNDTSRPARCSTPPTWVTSLISPRGKAGRTWPQ